MKKMISIALALLLASTCAFADGEIAILSREDGSGTLSAFTELFGIEDIAPKAVITNSTAVMMTTVAGNPDAIGYISLGSLNETVKAIAIDGVLPSVETILDGTYTISRPFNIATTAEVSELAQDFIDFILSKEGQVVVLANGYIPVIVQDEEQTQQETPYVSAQIKGSIVVAGSSSVTPVMEKLIEAYALVNPNAEIELQQSDSSTGINSLADGVCDIGMASRALKESELAKGVAPTVIAMDGIAVIVNLENTITGMTSEQVNTVYTGEIQTWSEITE